MNPCVHWDGAAATRCGAVPTRFYIQGWRCTANTPAAIAGEPEPPAGYCAPKRCLCGDCPSWTLGNPYASLVDSWVTDARNIATGKRRASPELQAAAKATVAEQRERESRLRARAP
ncbi:hypothetical protein [Nonomuraea lactucae]|uniref:hypothetical protein n=1 Tax=Nonomuraea lactucae TaxID=2249762 RepID=UPI000DE4C8F4|nr:hypothetical protein [Nonomuraea lactucae]